MITPLLLLASLPHYQPLGPGQFRFVGPAAFTLDAAGIHSSDIHISFGAAHSIPQQTGATVTYEHLWPGITAEFHHRNQAPELDFVLAPGAPTHAITLAAQGAAKATILPNGGLRWSNRNQSIEWKPPRAWLNHDSTKQLPVRYRRIDQQTIGFTVEGWDGRAALRIDPEWVISTWHQDGAQHNIGLPGFPREIPIQSRRNGAVVLHPDGFAVIASWSSLTSETSNVLPGQTAGNCILTLSTPQGPELTAGVRMRAVRWGPQCTPTAVTVDAGGAIWVAGTGSPGTINPTSNAYRRDAAPGDGFLMRIRKDLTAVEYATYLGGFRPVALTATNRLNEILATGWGFSDYTLPAGYRNPATGPQNIGIIRFNADGIPRWGAHLGPGSAPVTAFDAASDSVYIASNNNGCRMAKLGGDGSRLLASQSYGNRACEIRHLQVEQNGDIIAIGAAFDEGFEALNHPDTPVMEGPSFTVGFMFRWRPDFSMVWSWKYPRVAFAAAARSSNGDIQISTYEMDPAWRTSDALSLGGNAGLMSLRATTGAVAFAGHTGIVGSVPLVAAGTQNRVVLVSAADLLTFMKPEQPNSRGSFAYQWIQFGDTTPKPAQFTFQGATRGMTKSGTLQLSAAAQPMTVFPRPNATNGATLTLATAASGTPADIPFTITYAGVTVPSIHSASIELSTNGGTIAPSRVPVVSYVDQLVVPPNVQLTVGRTQPATATLPLRCSFGIPVQVTSSQPWLRILTTTEVCPAQIRYVVDASQLEPAVHNAQITVTPIGAPSDARQTAVQVTVR